MTLGDRYSYGLAESRPLKSSTCVSQVCHPGDIVIEVIQSDEFISRVHQIGIDLDWNDSGGVKQRDSKKAGIFDGDPTTSGDYKRQLQCPPVCWGCHS